MIFVTVGTHEQPFDRLIKAVDMLKYEGKIREDVFMQTGSSTYEPRSCQWSRMLPYGDMRRYIGSARIVITHGGPSSFMMPVQMRKVPVVVPRQVRFGEHVNDHQVEFIKRVAEENSMILPVYDIEDLGDRIAHYGEYAAGRAGRPQGHNEAFNHDLEAIIDELMAR